MENSFSENLIKFPENAKKHICFFQFETICPIIKHKNIWRGTLILVKVAGWSAASLKLTLQHKLSQIQNKAHSGVVLVCFSLIFWKKKTTKFPDTWFLQMVKTSLVLSFYPNSSNPKIPLFFNTFLIWASPNMQRKKSSDPCKFPAAQ